MAELSSMPVTATPPVRLLHYRPWQGSLRDSQPLLVLGFFALQLTLLVSLFFLASLPWVRLILAAVYLLNWTFVVRFRAWPITRVSLWLLFRRKIFWAILGLALLVFFMFFFGQYIIPWAEIQIGDRDIPLGRLGSIKPGVIIEFLKRTLELNGSSVTFVNFFWFEGYSVMILLALGGSVIIGNDLRFGSLPFFLAKPISSFDYILGKALAVAVLVNLVTTVPAIVLFIQYGMLDSWEYYLTDGHLLAGIFGYSMVLTLTLTPILLGVASKVRTTVPLIMTWTTLFFFFRLLSIAMVEGLRLDAHWRLIDLWNSAYVLGNLLLDIEHAKIKPQPQPEALAAAGVLVVVAGGCLAWLILRVRGVEVVK
jgi:hypothetical protein